MSTEATPTDRSALAQPARIAAALLLAPRARLTPEQQQAQQECLAGVKHTIDTPAPTAMTEATRGSLYLELGKDVRMSIVNKIEQALVEAGVLFLESGHTRDGGRGLRFRQ